MFCGTPRLQYIRNKDIGWQVRVDKTILGTVNTKCLIWYGSMGQMHDGMNWVPLRRQEWNRPMRSLKKERVIKLKKEACHKEIGTAEAFGLQDGWIFFPQNIILLSTIIQNNSD